MVPRVCCLRELTDSTFGVRVPQVGFQLLVLGIGRLGLFWLVNGGVTRSTRDPIFAGGWHDVCGGRES